MRQTTMNFERLIRDYERETLYRYDQPNDLELGRAQFGHIDLDGPRPHGCNPAIFNGPCDCDDCQYWDANQERDS